MAYALAKEQEQFIDRMVQQGRYNNQSEVVREALRRMERDEASYLNPPPLSKEDRVRLFGPNPEAEERERIAARTTRRSIRRLIKKSNLQHGDL